MARARRVIDATKMGDHALRLIGSTDIDGKGTHHEIAAIDPIVLFDFVEIDTSVASAFRPHPHVGLTAMSFLPARGSWMAWDSLEGESDRRLEAGGLYYVHAGTPAFHHEFPSPDTVAAGIEVEFIQLVWNATDEEEVRTVVLQPDEVPVVPFEQGSMRVLAGDFFGASAHQPFTHRKIIYAYVQLDIGGHMTCEVPSSMRGMLFLIEGALAVDGTAVEARQMLVLGEDESAAEGESDGNKTLQITNHDADHSARFILALGEPVNKPFHKLLGLGGFIIGETEEALRASMADLELAAEDVKREVPQYFPAQYLS
ncbi:MAG: pirin-like C-terminal cupin domain-containing protein [Pseudomonadota bacterium]